MKKTSKIKTTRTKLGIKTQVVRPLDATQTKQVAGGMVPEETRGRTCTCCPCYI